MRGSSKDWGIITRDFFDLMMKDEPHHSLSLLVNTNTQHSQYIFRVLGATRYNIYNSKFIYIGKVIEDELSLVFTQKTFFLTSPCSERKVTTAAQRTSPE